MSAEPDDRGLGRRTLVGAACLSLAPLALNIISVPVMAYIIRRLGPDGYAQWMVATSLLAVSAVLTNLGLRGAFVRSVAADPTSARAALADQLGLRLLLTMLAGTLVVLLCLLLGYPPAVLLCTGVGAAGLILTTLATTLGDVLQAFRWLKTMAAVSLAAGLALTSASVVAAWRGAGPVEMAGVYLIGPLVSAGLLGAIVRRDICPVTMRWDVRRFIKLLACSRFFAVQQLLSAGSVQAEALLLPRLIGMNQFGFFTAGAMPANRLGALPDGLCTAAYPVMARAWARSASGGGVLVCKLLLVALAGGVMIALAGTFLANAIGEILFPGRAMLFAAVIRVTIWSLPLVAVESVMGYALNAAGKDGAQARAFVPATAMSLIISVSLVLGFGVTGACWSMLLRPAVRAAFLTPVVIRTFRPSPLERPTIRVVHGSRAGGLLRKAG